MISHVVAHFGPYREQGALALVVAGPVFVGLAKVTRHDWPIDGSDNLTEGQLLGWAGQDVTPANAALTGNDSGALEREQDLFQVGLGESGALRDVSDRGRATLFFVEGEAEQRTAGVVTSG